MHHGGDNLVLNTWHEIMSLAVSWWYVVGIQTVIHFASSLFMRQATSCRYAWREDDLRTGMKGSFVDAYRQVIMDLDISRLSPLRMVHADIDAVSRLHMQIVRHCYFSL